MGSCTNSTGMRFLLLCALFFTLNVWADPAFDKLIEAGKYDDALKYADDNLPAGNRDGATWAKLGTANEHVGMSEKALACYMVAVRTDPHSFDGYLGAARIYNKMGNADMAQSYAQKAVAINPTGEASWEYAQACIAFGKPADAKSALEKVVQSDPSNVIANKALGTIYYDEKAFDKALAPLKLSQDKQADADVALKIARIYRDKGGLDDAVTYYKAALTDKKSPKPEANLELARIYIKQQQFGPAAESFDKADQTQLTADDFYNWASALEKTNGDKEKIGAKYQSAADKFGSAKTADALQARSYVGHSALDKKNYSEALKQFEFIYKADSTEKNFKDLDFLLSDANLGAGNQKAAIVCLERAIAHDKDNVEGYARLGDLYTKIGMAEKSQAIYEKLITLQPNNPKVHKALGAYNLKAKKYDEALKNYQKGFMLEPDAPTAVGMMKAAWETGKTDVARDAAESALHYDANLRDPLVILSKIYMTEKNYAGAKQNLESLVKKDPDNKDIWQQLATCYGATNDTAKRADADKKIMGLDKSDTTSRFRFAAYAITQNDLPGALAALKELSVLVPQNDKVVKKLYEVSLKAGNKDDAIEYLKKYVALKPAVAEAQRDLGNMLFDKKDATGALAAYRAALKANPSIKGFFKNFTDLIISTKGPEQEVITVLTSAIKANEADVETYTTLGMLYQKQGQYATALEMYQKALTLKPQSFEVLSSLALCQEKAGKPGDAIVSYEQAIALNPSSVKEQKSLGDLYLQQGKKSEAISAYRKYLDKTTPADSKIALIVGDYLYDQKSYSDAVKYMGMVSGANAQTSEFLFRYGTAAYQAKDNAKTTQLFKQLIVLTPKSPGRFKTLGEIAIANKEPAAASTYLKKYLALRPDDAPMQVELGNISYDLKDSRGAIAAYNAGLKSDPTSKGFYKKYVELEMTSGTNAEKIVALNGAIAASEADAKMYAQLGEIYKKEANYPKAIESLTKASQMDSKNGDLLASLADCQAKSGDIANAVITYEQAIAMNPAASKEYKTLGDLYMQQKKPESAVPAYKKYLEKNSDNAITRLVGDAAYKSKNYAEAEKYFGMVTGDDSRSASFLTEYGKACYDGKDDTKALTIYKQLAVASPSSSQVFYNLYDLSKRGGSADSALVYLKKYTALKPGDAPAQQALGDMLYDRKDNSGALTAYRAVLKADPTAKGFYKKYVELVGKNGSRAELASVLSRAISANEADVTMFISLADIYKAETLCTKAIPLYNKASQLDPKNGAVLTSLAICQAKSGSIGDAVVTLEQALVMNRAPARTTRLSVNCTCSRKKPNQRLARIKSISRKIPITPSPGWSVKPRIRVKIMLRRRNISAWLPVMMRRRHHF